MRPLVFCQDTRLLECLVTIVTPEKFLLYVDYFMLCQVTRFGQCLVTRVTLEWFLHCVGSVMLSGRHGEYFVTLIKLERLVPCAVFLTC